MKVEIGSMNRIVVISLFAVGMVPSFLAADPSDSRLPLLEKLRTERQASVADPSRVDARKPQIGLNPLLGLARNKLLQFLGTPDFCGPQGCIKSTHLAYVYYPYKPSTVKDVDNGIVEVTVTAGGGWALEIDLAHDSVTKAFWVKQT